MGHGRSTFEIDAALARIAQCQFGLVTVSQAAEAGIDARALSRRRETRALVPLFPGVLRLGASGTSRCQTVLGGCLAVPGSIVTGVSAALVHGMPVPRRSSQVTLSVPIGRTVRIDGISAARRSVDLPSHPWMTARIATPGATVLTLAPAVSADVLERCLDHGIAHRLLTADSVGSLVESLPVRAVARRQRILGLVAARTGGVGHRSMLEQRVRRWLDSAGLRGWRRNHAVAVHAGGSVEVDFGWVGARVALEVSPFFTHGSRVTQERDADRRRLLLLARWRVVEALDHDLEDERAFAATAATLRTLLRSGP